MNKFEHMPLPKIEGGNNEKININQAEKMEGEKVIKTAVEMKELRLEKQEQKLSGVLEMMKKETEVQMQNLPEMVQGAIRQLLKFAKDEKTELGVKVIGELILLLPIAGIPGGVIKIIKLLKGFKEGAGTVHKIHKIVN